MKAIVVIGGTGNVGRGIVAAALERGRSVTVVDPDGSRFGELAEEQLGAKSVVGGFAGAEQAKDLAQRRDLADVDAVVLALNTPWTPSPALSTTSCRSCGLELCSSAWAAAWPTSPRAA